MCENNLSTKNNHLVLVDNPHVSALHCYISKDPDGNAWLTDCSANGTKMNIDGFVHNDTIPLQHGDIIHIVKSLKKGNISFRFILHNTDEALAEEPTTSDIALEQTLPLEEEETEQGTEENPPADAAAVPTKLDEVSEEPVVKKAKLSESATSVVAAADVVIPDLTASLECSICKEIMYQCVSIHPCIHCFCASCLLDWRRESHNDCPTCRGPINGVSKNHLVSSLIESYLTANPSFQRSEADKKELDDKVREHSAVLYASVSSLSNRSRGAHTHTITLGGYLTPIISISSMGPHCRSCFPQQQSTMFNANAPGYQNACAPGNAHIECHCCNYPMPDLRSTPNVEAVASSSNSTTMASPPAVNNIQQCSLCARPFCYQFYGSCPMLGCVGCLRSARDLSLQYNYPQHNHFLLQNSHETDILLEALDDLDAGRFASCGEAVSFTVTSSSLLCSRCYRITLLPNLLLAYRWILPSDQLAQEDVDRIAVRANCRYGIDCRTQRHNLSHAQRYNHICSSLQPVIGASGDG